MHHATTQQMQMDMENDLPARLVAVHHGAVAGLGETLASRNLAHGTIHTPHDHFFLRLEIVERGDMFPRHDQDVCRRLRIEVAESDYRVVFVHLVRRDVASGNLAEYTVFHSSSPWLLCRLGPATPPDLLDAQITAPGKGVGQGPAVDVLQFATQRYPVRDA